MHVRVCPRCNSPNVELDRALMWGDRIYVCKRCSFSSTLFPELILKNPSELKKLKLKPIKKVKK